MFEMTIKKGAKQNVIVAERDGRIEGVLTYADRPDCIPSARDSLAAVRIAGPRVLALIRDFRMVGKAHPRTPHRHLPVLGVRPEAQGLGIGGLLMSRVLPAAVTRPASRATWRPPAGPTRQSAPRSACMSATASSWPRWCR